MECAQIESIAEFLFGACTQLADFQFAEFVAECLAGPADVAIHFGGDFVFAEGCVVAQQRQCLIARPALGMHAGIDDQTRCAPHFVGQSAEMFVRVFIDAHLDAKMFGIQCPAFAECRDIAVATKRRLLALLTGQCRLQVMTGHGFVQGQRGQCIQRSRIKFPRIHPVKTCTLATFRRRAVTTGRVVGRDRCRHRCNAVRQSWQLAEILRQFAVDALGDVARMHQQFAWRLRVKLRIAAQEFQERRKIAIELGVMQHLLHLRTNACDFVQSDLMDGIGRCIQRGVFADLLLVIRLAFRQVVGGNRVACTGLIFLGEERQQTRIGGDHFLADYLACLGAQCVRIVGTDRGRQGFERCVERHGFDIAGLGDHGNRRLASGQHDTRQGHARFQARFEQADVFVEIRGNSRQTLEIVAIVRSVLLRMTIGEHAQIGVEAGVRCHRHQIRGALDAADGIVDLGDKNCMVHLATIAELRRIERRQILAECLQPLQARVLRLDIDVTEFGVVIMHADRSRQLRVFTQTPLPFALIQGHEQVVGLCRFGNRSGERKAQCQQHQQSNHDSNLGIKTRG